MLVRVIGTHVNYKAFIIDVHKYSTHNCVMYIVHILHIIFQYPEKNILHNSNLITLN